MPQLDGRVAIVTGGGVLTGMMINRELLITQPEG